MNKKLLIDTVGWGFLLWLVGYILGILLFAVVPISLIGWVIFPVGVIAILFVLLKLIKSKDFSHYVALAISWTAIAIVADYFLLVKLFNPPDGYYKLDVYLYYGLTFLLPLLIGWQKNFKSRHIRS